jgi:pimeloyl-ACP methyl ester carboxylesterase
MSPTLAATYEHAGCRLYYWIEGPAGAPLVVFSHGATADHTMFDQQADAVAGRYRMLRWDLRGQGLSRPADPPFSCLRAADDLASLLGHLGEDKVALVGQSIGGNVGQEFIFRYPERCTAALFLGCTCSTGPLSWTDRLLLKIAPSMLAFYSADALRKAAANGSAATYEARERLLQMMTPLSKAEIVVIFSEIVRGLHPEPGYRIACPILIAHGASDDLGNIKKVAPSWAAREGAPAPSAIPNAGHAANMDNPQAFNRLMMDFLAAHYPPPMKS